MPQGTGGAVLGEGSAGLGAVTGNYGRPSVLAADVRAPLCAYRCDVVLGGPDTIVVGFDGTPRAEDGLALGELLAVRGVKIAPLGFRARVADRLDAHVAPR